MFRDEFLQLLTESFADLVDVLPWYDETQSFHVRGRDGKVHADEVLPTHVQHHVVEAGIATGYRLEVIVQARYDLHERHLEHKAHSVVADVIHLRHRRPSFLR